MLIIFLRSTLFNIVFPVFTLVYCTLFCPLLISKRLAIKVMVIWAKCNLFLLKFLCKIDYVVKGEIPESPVLIGAQHQSSLEILILIAHLRNPVFMLKKVYMMIPVFGIYLQRLDMIPVSQSKKNSLNWADQIKQAWANNKSIVIFPEGTRVAPGVTVPYKYGIFKMANVLGAKKT